MSMNIDLWMSFMCVKGKATDTFIQHIHTMGFHFDHFEAFTAQMKLHFDTPEYLTSFKLFSFTAQDVA